MDVEYMDRAQQPTLDFFTPNLPVTLPCGAKLSLDAALGDVPTVADRSTRAHAQVHQTGFTGLLRPSMGVVALL